MIAACLRLRVIVAGLTVACFGGCDRSTPGNGSQSPQSPSTEEMARANLKIGLDSWVFGDSREKFSADHKDIKFLDVALPFAE